MTIMHSKKLNVTTRRIKLGQPAKRYQVRPDLCFRTWLGRTDVVAKALYLLEALWGAVWMLSAMSSDDSYCIDSINPGRRRKQR